MKLTQEKVLFINNRGKTMASNKKVREEMVDVFGNRCWVDKLKLRSAKTLKGTHKGRKLKNLKKDKVLTYHHIIMKKDGGKPTISNGALLSEENHTWFHKQKQWKQDKMNQYFQQYKINFIMANFDDELALEITKLQIDYDELNDDDDYVSIPYDEIDDLNTEIYNRAKVKRNTMKKFKEWQEKDERE